MILFITHVNNAVAYNLPYGIYYYAHAAIIDKANWVDKQIKTYLNGQNPPLGIWYDAEDKSMLKYNINLTYSPCLKAGDSWIQTILAY